MGAGRKEVRHLPDGDKGSRIKRVVHVEANGQVQRTFKVRCTWNVVDGVAEIGTFFVPSGLNNMNELTFTSLESQVLEWLLAGEDPVLNELRQQLRSSSIESRQYTGVGFYLKFDVPHNVQGFFESSKVKTSFCFGDVDVELTTGNYQQRVGFLLWVENGYLDQLEAYTYGDEKWPEKIDEIHLRYLGNQRDLEDLRRNWEL
jgi:hypothetical protein